jgi:hypothetical protein
MKTINEIETPVYLKTDKNMEWPKDRLFYIMSADGLFLCRNHEWFQSCTLAKRGPGELEGQQPFAHINYPKVPKLLIEKAVGFFRRIEKEKGWESALILVWNRKAEMMELICPDQKCSWGGVEYDIPQLPQHLALIGDIHSHPTFSPKPSVTDEDDELGRPGLHIVAGYIAEKKSKWDKDPEFHAVVVVDGQRFTINDQSAVMEPFESVQLFPEEWLKKVKASPTKSWSGGGYEYTPGKVTPPSPDDERALEVISNRILKSPNQPVYYEVKQELFTKSKTASYLWCEQKAEDIVKQWKREHGQDDTTTLYQAGDSQELFH